MAHPLKTISKRSTFVLLREKGKFIRGKAFNLQFLEDSNLENIIFVGFTALSDDTSTNCFTLLLFI